MASNSGTLVAPPNFVQTWGKANTTYGDVEAVNTLVENVESKDRELQVTFYWYQINGNI